jgi:signal transduction histidine kinase/AmiR/NasT family two-component response regulator
MTRILVVEDETIVAENIRKKLNDLNYIVVGVESTGEAAIAQAEILRPDLILMDIGLAGRIDGVVAAGRIRNRFDIPVLYLTAYADEEVLERAKLTEPAGFLIKPFERRELRTTIETSLYRHQMDRKLRDNVEQLKMAYKQAQFYAEDLTRDITSRKKAEKEIKKLNQELEQRVADRTRELSALYDVTAAAVEFFDLDATLPRLLSRVLEGMRSTMGVIHLLAETDGVLYLATQQGLPTNLAAQLSVTTGAGSLVSQVMQQGEPLIVPDLSNDSRVVQELAVAPGTAYVGVPIRARGRILGVLGVFKEKAQSQFNMDEITLLTAIADHVGVVVESARLRQLAEQAAVMEERARLARNLHDSVTQLLYSSTLLAEVGRESYRQGDIAEVNHCLTELGQIARQALKEMRLMIYELRPPVLIREGLVGALQHRLDAVEGRAGVQARLLADETLELPGAIEEELYHIAQEILNNALKHAGAAAVTAQIHAANGQVELTISDNGQGFDPAVVGQAGMGLLTMRERAAKVGGHLSIVSAPGQGTTVKVSVKTD